MKRGEIYYANLDPTLGSETNKTRPVLIVSSDFNNRASNTITIIPITSQISKIYPFEVYLDASKSGLNQDSKAQCQQIRTISKKRIAQNVGKINDQTMLKIEYAIKIHLAIP